MNILKYARYEYCAKKACEFLEEFNIKSYPIDVEKIIHDQKWGLTPYSLLMEKFNCDRQTVIRCLRSEDGYTQLDCDNYSIAYNDDPKLGDRKRFTLMHEVGHIYLKHLAAFEITLLYRGSLSKEENRVLENEANAFARNVLAPATIVMQLKDKTPENISQRFGITYNAANTRINLLRTDNQNIDELGLLSRMTKLFQKFYYKTECLNCHAALNKRYGRFCPICGSKNTLQWGDGDQMKYPLLETHENGKLKECPNCRNEETNIEGDFCQICGKNIVNKCPNYDCSNVAILPSNARFCPICGSNSTFYNLNFLRAWNYASTQDGLWSIPVGFDEELPFN